MTDEELEKSLRVKICSARDRFWVESDSDDGVILDKSRFKAGVEAAHNILHWYNEGEKNGQGVLGPERLENWNSVTVAIKKLKIFLGE